VREEKSRVRSSRISIFWTIWCNVGTTSPIQLIPLGGLNSITGNETSKNHPEKLGGERRGVNNPEGGGRWVEKTWEKLQTAESKKGPTRKMKSSPAGEQLSYGPLA